MNNFIVGIDKNDKPITIRDLVKERVLTVFRHKGKRVTILWTDNRDNRSSSIQFIVSASGAVKKTVEQFGQKSLIKIAKGDFIVDLFSYRPITNDSIDMSFCRVDKIVKNKAFCSYVSEPDFIFNVPENIQLIMKNAS